MPAKDIKIYEHMLFSDGTTYRNDFPSVKFKVDAKTTFKEKPVCLIRRQPNLKDLHTMSDRKAPIAFSTTHAPKPILQTDPRKTQQAYSLPVDEELERAIATRPRLVMTPGLSLDDIEDARSRDILCTDMYTSEMTRTTREAVCQYFSVRAPLPGTYAPANPICLPKLREPVVSPEWRKDAAGWDRRQLRTHCDPTAQFWLRQTSKSCKACEKTTLIKNHRRLTTEPRFKQ